MGGYDLSEGIYKSSNCSEEELWKAFRNVFSTKTLNSSSYKFVFLKSIMDCIHRYNKIDYTFYEIFERFTEIYWILIVKYGLAQNNSNSKETYIEQILKEYVGCTTGETRITIRFNDLTPLAKDQIVHQVTKKCKKYVVGALYGDTNGLFYSFSKKKEVIELNPVMKDFVLQHEGSIEELNYFELTKFIDKVNSREKIDKIIREKGYKKNDSIEAYRQLLYDEFETEHISDSNLTEVNTIELLMEAEENYCKTRTIERENAYYKKLYEKEVSIEKDSENMKLYLDDPERVIKMIKVRHRISC